MTYRGVIVAGALVPLVLAVMGLSAWMTGAMSLASFGRAYIPMAPSTAIGFMPVSATLIALAVRDRSRSTRVAKGAAVLVFVLAVIKLAEFATGAPILNLEAFLMDVPGDFGAVPLGRMSPLSAFAFVAASVSLGSLAGEPTRRARNRGSALGAAIIVTSATVVLGYLYSAPLLYGGQIIPMALPTALAFAGLGTALVAFAGPTADLLAPFCGTSARARLLRVFLPLTVLAVLINGVLTNVILEHVRLNPALLAALFTLVSAAGIGIAVSTTARSLGSAIDQAETVLRQSQQELERRVQERTVELATLNRELEAFSYSVSHDLRTPLRHVLGFAAALRDEAGDHLGTQGLYFLTKVTKAAERMNGLIDDLLKLSRTGRVPLEKRPVRLALLVRDVLAEVMPQADARQIRWSIQQSLPDVMVDPGLFRVVLVNLLSNAVKYTSKQQGPHIEVGTIDTDNGQVVLYVRDNGVGFDMKYVNKLFGVFQRLHSDQEFEGTGVGLANVNRIVQRHGGRVWAEAAVDKGATFYVAIPAVPDNQLTNTVDDEARTRAVERAPIVDETRQAGSERAV